MFNGWLREVPEVRLDRPGVGVGLQTQGPAERLTADSVLEAFGARVQPCATSGQPVSRVGLERDTCVPNRHRDHSQ